MASVRHLHTHPALERPMPFLPPVSDDPPPDLDEAAGGGVLPLRQDLVTAAQHNRGALLSFFNRQGAGPDSEDLVQETFMRVFRYRDRYQACGKFSTFLYTVARRAWIDHCRRNMRLEYLAARYERESAISGQQPHMPVPQQPFDVADAVSQLPSKLRDVIDLHFFQGLPYQDIAEQMAIPVGTVKSRVNMAMKRLRDQASLI